MKKYEKIFLYKVKKTGIKCLNTLLILTAIIGVFCCQILVVNYNDLYQFKNYKNVIYATDESLSAPSQKFAKAKENCFLFKTSDITSTAFKNVYFCVPKSYFVTILAEINALVFKVEYKGKIGYVSKDSVVVATFTPVVPTLDDITFDISTASGTQLRSSPSAESSLNILKVISAGTKNIEYVSFISSAKPVGGNSSIWYYVYYFPEDDPTSFYEGYIYSEKAINLSFISENLECNPELISDDKNHSDGTTIASKNVKIVLIVLILLPIVLVLFIVAFRARAGAKIKREELKKCESDKSENNCKKTIKSLSGKSFILKENSKNSADEFIPEVSSITPIFPTYEVIDDDDLL